MIIGYNLSPLLPPLLPSYRLALIQPSLPADAYLGGWGSPPPTPPSP